MTIAKNKVIGYTAAILSTILMGSMGIFVRNITSNEYIITFARLGLGLFFLLSFLFITKEYKKIKITKCPFSLLSTGILMSFAIVCYINAIYYTSLANAAFLLYLGPLLAVGVAAIVLKEKLTLLNGGLLCLAFVGLLFPGRSAGCPTLPPQIRTCGIPAYGS